MSIYNCRSVSFRPDRPASFKCCGFKLCDFAPTISHTVDRFSEKGIGTGVAACSFLTRSLDGRGKKGECVRKMCLYD